MSYTIRPNVGDNLGNTRDPIRTNFEVIRDRFNQNHVGINSGATGGKHKFLQMPNQVGLPSGFAASDANLYAVTANTTTQLFYSNENSGNQYQLTRGNNANYGTFGGSAASGGWTFLPGPAVGGGMLFQYGRIAMAATMNVTFPFQFTVNCFAITIGPRTTQPRTYLISSFDTSGCVITASGSGAFTGDIHWMAIGI